MKICAHTCTHLYIHTQRYMLYVYIYIFLNTHRQGFMTGIHPYAIVVAGWIVYNKLFIFASGAKQGIRKERKMWSK